MWFLTATCEVPEAELNTSVTQFLGVDLGIVNIATTSDGQIMAGRRLNRGRLRERSSTRPRSAPPGGLPGSARGAVPAFGPLRPGCAAARPHMDRAKD
ncbi:hypothetical protein ACFRNJ_19655 [Streptomyces sp. NPDC056721]|uniref:hypothetical protein n=1 Tax=Streptomyces sp. NPDC056721 TaxID=3345923 RepID=UPI00369D14D2